MMDIDCIMTQTNINLVVWINYAGDLIHTK